MDLKLYDTLTREKRVFTPLDPACVRMYVCGPTVYDFAHIGNARPVIVFDVLFRLLRHIYGESHVTYVRNITDVDDKINARAAERGISIGELTKKTYEDFKADVAALGCLEPTIEPRATDHIEPMKTLIERLVKSGNAYVAEDHVLFDVPSMPDYGKLSNRTLDEMIAGARVEVAPYKRNPTDFVLWKPSKPGEPAWPSPAGIKTPGRPGWHIECSAMADHWLWTKAEPSLSAAGRAHPHQFDIHGGGIDLVFPHHENEIAQSRCAFHTGVMANYWMHNGFLQVEGEKMSKSVGNFVTIRELRESWKGHPWPGEALRFNMLRTHYHDPMDWTVHSLDESHKILHKWYAQLKDVKDVTDVSSAVLEALCDDLNTPAAITALHALWKDRNFSALRSSLKFLGFSCAQENILRNVPFVQDLSQDAASQIAVAAALRRREYAAAIGTGVSAPPLPLLFNEKVETLIASRNKARQEKNFSEADRIRDELAAMGVVLKDSKDGTTWEIAR